MRIILWGILGFAFAVPGFALEGHLPVYKASKVLLPSPYPVYVIKNSGVINHPYPGAIKALLPTDNSYTGIPGCYIACYSHKNGVYSVSPTVSVAGQIRVKGQYVARICQPEGYQGKDISSEPTFQLLCAKKIPACADQKCWGGGDTGGWFGIQL